MGCFFMGMVLPPSREQLEPANFDATASFGLIFPRFYLCGLSHLQPGAVIKATGK